MRIVDSPTKGICTVPNCGRKRQSKGWCGTHYARWKTTGSVQAEKPVRIMTPTGGACGVDECDRSIRNRGFCEPHYRQFYKTGKAEGPIRPQIPKTEGCSVPDCLRPHCSKGLCSMHWQRVRYGKPLGDAARRRVMPGDKQLNAQGYVMIGTPGGPKKRVLEHRLLMEQLLGRPLERHETVHHRNGQRADNRTDGPLVNFRSGNLELWSSWQPTGQRVDDKIEFAVELLSRYAPQLLAGSEPHQIGIEDAGVSDGLAA